MLNKRIKSMIEKGILFGGKITDFDGFKSFTRISIKELEKLPDAEIAFATPSMGRAIFQICEDGSIKNIKGVDSHLDNKDIALTKLSGAQAVYLTTDGKEYQESIHPINLIVFPNKQLDIRIRGTSPLEDIEIEADINSKMQNLGIKLPEILSVREYPYDIAKRLGLPSKTPGNYEEFISNYVEENKERKQHLHDVYKERYEEDLPEGLRPEKISEYFKRIGILDADEFREFASKNGFSVEDFIQYVDSSYSLGQRYGQAVRKMGSPFRISDLEYYVQENNVEALQEIMDYTNETINGNNSVEELFANQMGINIANMMNAGWMCENFVHRQDYALTGEMCDDSYFDLPEKIKRIEEHNKSDEGKCQAIKEDKKRQFFSQIYLISSNIKILQDEMKLRGKKIEEIEDVFNCFIDAFTETIDFEKVAKSFGTTYEFVEQYFMDMIKTPKDYVKMMAGASRPGRMIYDEAIIRAHNGNNDFYNKVSTKISEKLRLQNISAQYPSNTLHSAIEATEDNVTTEKINEQARNIKELHNQKELPENEQNVTK